MGGSASANTSYKYDMHSYSRNYESDTELSVRSQNVKDQVIKLSQFAQAVYTEGTYICYKYIFNYVNI